MDKDEIISKIAHIETRLDVAVKRAGEDRERLQRIDSNIAAINNRLARYEGKMGGILLVIGLLWSGLLFFKDSILRFLKHG